jgi:hypothetical protein
MSDLKSQLWGQHIEVVANIFEVNDSVENDTKRANCHVLRSTMLEKTLDKNNSLYQ